MCATKSRSLPFVYLKVTTMIAIVEDDASVRAATQSLVRSLGFAACSFSDAEEFLRSPYAAKASCLIADVQTLIESLDQALNRSK